MMALRGLSPMTDSLISRWYTVKLKIKTLLFAASFVTCVCAVEPIDPTLYSGFTVTDDGGARNKVTVDGSSIADIAVREALPNVNFTVKRSFTEGKMATWVAPITLNVLGNNFDYYSMKRMVKGDDGKWAVEIDKASNNVQANTPYLIVPTANIDSVRYFGVTLVPTENKCITFENKTEDDFVFDFCGTYNYIEWADDEVGSIYGFAAGDGTNVSVGDFSRGAPGAKIRPMRAYLKYKGRKSKNGAKAAAGRVAVLDDDVVLPSTIEVRIIEKEGSTQSIRIGTMDPYTGEVALDKWVDLKGRFFKQKPEVQGTYYNNGRKVIVK